MVRQLLMLARLESGQLECSDACRLHELLAAVAEDMQPMAEDRGMVIQTALTPCELSINRAMLVRAVVNLLDNAVRYGREKGTITLTLARTDEHVLITVHDDGPGLKPDELDRVFTRFWRGDGARSTSGTGIGLSLVHSIVRAHGGSVSVQSGAGDGTAFTLSLPVKKTEEI